MTEKKATSRIDKLFAEAVYQQMNLERYGIRMNLPANAGYLSDLRELYNHAITINKDDCIASARLCCHPENLAETILNL